MKECTILKSNQNIDDKYISHLISEVECLVFSNSLPFDDVQIQILNYFSKFLEKCGEEYLSPPSAYESCHINLHDELRC